MFTDFMPGRNPGVLDWFTVLAGVLALAILALHGSLYLRMKTAGPVRDRSEGVSKKLFWAVIVLVVLATIGTSQVAPELYPSIVHRPIALVLAIVAVACLVSIPVLVSKGSENLPFLASCGFLATVLASTAVGVFPTLLHSTIDPAYDLTIDTAKAGGSGLQIGLPIWGVAIILVVIYFVHLFRSFHGKVDLSEGYGH